MKPAQETLLCAWWRGVIEKIAKRTTGAKGCNFLAGFLQVSHMVLKHDTLGTFDTFDTF